MNTSGANIVGHFHSKIAGVSQPGRQPLIRQLAAGQPLTLQRDRANQHDKNAVKILNSRGQHLGFIPKDTALGLARSVYAARRYACFVSELTGAGTATTGCNLLVIWTEGDAPPADIDAYCQAKGFKVGVRPQWKF